VSVADDDLPALELGVKPEQVLAVLERTPDFSAAPRTERRRRSERLRRELSWIKMVDDLRVSGKKQLTPFEGRKQRKQIADTAEKLLRLLRNVGDWQFLNRAAKDQMESWSMQCQRIQFRITNLRRREQRTRKRADSKAESCIHLQLKLTRIETAIAKLRSELHALDRKRAGLGRRLDDTHPEAEEPAADLVVQEVASALELLIPLLRDIGGTDHETQIEAGARKWVAYQLQELAWKYVRSRSHAATAGKPGPALRFAEAASFVIIPRFGIPWPALQEHWRGRPKRATRGGNISTKKINLPYVLGRNALLKLLIIAPEHHSGPLQGDEQK
jgi:hypothetical protein